MANERIAVATVQPTITAGAYSANDVVGGLLGFSLLNGYRQVAGFIRSVRISDDDNEKAALKLHLFESAPAAIADNAAFAPSFADLRKRFAVIAIAAADFTTINSNAQAIVSTNTSLDFQAENATIYGYLVCDATPTYTAVTDLVITLTAYLL